MATDKDLEAKKEPETQEDAKKAPETGEPSIEYLVEGLTEEELAGVSGGLTPGLETKLPFGCTGVQCSGVKTSCATWCGTMNCPAVTCGSHNCGNFNM